MREIKFRAYDVLNKQWLPDGWFVKLPDITLNFGEHMHLMQYTGLKDKNGMEIYEGDILSWSEHYSGDYRHRAGKGAVVFEEGGFDISPLDAKNWAADLSTLSVNNYCEVIGNIYENKDLL